ncbi:MAG: sn-glycerol-3-phosphate ABC transporter ATP-binding protein UgpC [Planctomycetota bacterium]|nr:sn-glycerol-3-phosphate ABC transporter ATP-binding protein UgpC [Planctomycetota bacterium]
MASISIRNIRKLYAGKVEAVAEFSLEIADGEFIVLVGPSGCGKSTVLRMIAGLEDCSAGDIAIDGRVVTDVEPKDRDIAMVFQNYALYPHMTVRKNMGFALRLRGLSRDDVDRRVRQVADTLGIAELLDRRPGELSGGQRQRVAVGRAIVREPKAFLFDEPLSNLDARLRVRTRAELRSLHQRLRTTSIYVTHDQEEAMTLGDRIVVMSKGLVRQVGTPLDVYNFPGDRFVAGFVGTPPMNFLEGTLSRGAGELWFTEHAAGPPAQADAPPVRLRASPAHETHLAPHVGKPVILGLRPQLFRLDAGAGAPDAVRLPVRVVETLGDCMDIHCRRAEQGLVARVPAGPTVRAGDFAALLPDMTHARWFEPGEFGRALVQG